MLLIKKYNKTSTLLLMLDISFATDLSRTFLNILFSLNTARPYRTEAYHTGDGHTAKAIPVVVGWKFY